MNVPRGTFLFIITPKISLNSFDSFTKIQKNPTTRLSISVFVGEPGIGPGPLGPKPSTLPLCYTPMSERNSELQYILANILNQVHLNSKYLRESVHGVRSSEFPSEERVKALLTTRLCFGARTFSFPSEEGMYQALRRRYTLFRSLQKRILRFRAHDNTIHSTKMRIFPRSVTM